MWIQIHSNPDQDKVITEEEINKSYLQRTLWPLLVLKFKLLLTHPHFITLFVIFHYFAFTKWFQMWMKLQP